MRAGTFRIVCWTLAVVAGSVLAAARDDKPATPTPEAARLSGKIVEIGPYVKDHFGVTMDDEQGQSVALVTESGELYPIIKDLRSRGLFMDKRMHHRPMELEVHRYAGLPFLQVIEVYSVKEGKKYRVDYWCSICAISTFQPGPCPCCQAEIELREQEVEEGR